MPTPIADFARAASDATRACASFEAHETVRAGDIDISARVRFRAPDRVSVEFLTYTSPFAEMEDLLGGYAEMAPADLVGSTLAYDGRVTRYVNPKTAIALMSSGRRLYEPVPGITALAEIAFVDDLARDYLLRERGDAVCGGRAARVLGLKPKHDWVSSLFRTKSYLLERGELSLDAETHFPLRVEFVPARETAAAAALGPDGRVVVEYTNVRLLEIDESAFAPTFTPGTRVFTEEALPFDSAAKLPFPLPGDAAASRGFAPVENRLVLVLDEPRERGYATLVFRRPPRADRSEAALIVRVGNYMSRLMARRRTLAADRGEAAEMGGVSARYVDRRALLGPDLAARGFPPLGDIVWDRDGLFWAVSVEGLSKDEALDVASSLV